MNTPISKTIWFYFVIVFNSILVSNCIKSSPSSIAASKEPEPTANFITDKTEYIAGETINLTNLSTNAYTYIWTLPDSRTVTSEDINYTIPVNTGNAKLNFKLEAFSKTGSKSNSTVQQISVKAATGQLVLYDGYTTMPISISIDGQNPVNVVLPLSIPTCGQSGYTTFTLSVGSHYLRATGGPYSGNIQNFEIKANECTAFRVNF